MVALNQVSECSMLLIQRGFGCRVSVYVCCLCCERFRVFGRWGFELASEHESLLIRCPERRRKRLYTHTHTHAPPSVITQKLSITQRGQVYTASRLRCQLRPNIKDQSFRKSTRLSWQVWSMHPQTNTCSAQAGASAWDRLGEASDKSCRMLRYGLYT